MAESTATRSRAIEKAVTTLKSGDFYEAQQLFKTVYHRQRSRKQYNESYATLQEGAKLQLEAGHVTCGVELGLLLVDALIDDAAVPDAAGMDRVISLVAAFPPPAQQTKDQQNGSAAGQQQSTAVEEFSRLIAAASKWAKKMPHLSWKPIQQINGMYADYLWKGYGQEQLARVFAHVSRSDDAKLHASVIKSVAPAQALDLFLTNSVLTVLSSATASSKATQLEHSKVLCSQLAQECLLPPSSKDGSRQPAPLYNFCTLLIEAIERGSLPLVMLLRDRYGPSLMADASWDSCLNRIETAYLGARRGGRAGGSGGGGLAGMLQQMMAGLPENFEDAESDEGRIDDDDEDQDDEGDEKPQVKPGKA